MLPIGYLPPELTTKPDPLIGLSGLDVDNNPVHRSIWRAFSTGRSRDRDSLKFKCLPLDHPYPKPKSKPLGNNDWFLPKGILKTGWIRKHVEELPAVVAFFYDLDWDEQQWEEKSTECAHRLDVIRSHLAGRDSKLVVILIQKRALLPLGEDITATERAQALCLRCDLPGKNLFVLSNTNLLFGCVTRLESEFRDMASNHYHNLIKRVKSHKDTLNKTSHQLLLVRYEFKVAFFNELKQDVTQALRHYQQAYTHLLEQRMVNIHILEMKTVAGFINYKICRLAFQTNASDAIGQFRKHYEFFTPLIGMPALAFEHEAWLSKQFEHLGDLFQEAIHSNLTALMTQHPGLYYQEAARHAIARRQLAHVLCSNSEPFDPLPEPEPESASPITRSGLAIEDQSSGQRNLTSLIMDDGPVGNVALKSKRSSVSGAVDFVRTQSPLRLYRRSIISSSDATNNPTGRVTSPLSFTSATEAVDGLEFYGQRPWRQGIQSIDVPDIAKEHHGIRSLQHAELSVDHSELIIPLLEHTHLYYKRYKAERMKDYPCILMGCEYYGKGNFAKALNCFSSVLTDYRSGNWSSIFTYVLQYILKCSYLAGQVENFSCAALELLGPSTTNMLSLEYKERVQLALFAIFQGQIPDFSTLLLDDALNDSVMDCAVGDLFATNLHPYYAYAQKPDNASLACVSAAAPTSDAVLPKLILDMTHLHGPVECKVAFTRACFSVDQPVQLAVFVRSHAPLSLRIHRVAVDCSHVFSEETAYSTSSTQSRQTIQKTTHTWNTPFTIEPSNLCAKLLLFCLNPHQLDEHVEVEAIRMDLTHPNIEEVDRSVELSLLWRLHGDHSNTAQQTSNRTRSKKSPAATTKPPPNRVSSDADLWDPYKLGSARERRLQFPTFSHPHGSRELTVPSIPPKWDLVVSRLYTDILPRQSGLQVSLSHDSPALASEHYTVKCEILNSESNNADKIKFAVSLSEHVTDHPSSEDTIFQTSGRRSTDYLGRSKLSDQLWLEYTDTSAQPPITDQPNPPSSTRPESVVQALLDLPDLSSNQKQTCLVHLRFSEPGDRSLHCQFTYKTQFSSPALPHCLLILSPHGQEQFWSDCRVEKVHDDDSTDLGDVIEHRCIQSARTLVGVVTPFDLCWNVLSLQQQLISDLVIGEPFLLRLKATNVSPSNLKVLRTCLNLPNPVEFVDGECVQQISNVCLHSGGRFAESQMLMVNGSVEQDSEVVSLGSYSIIWCRDSSKNEADECVTADFPLPSHSLLALPIRVYAHIPPMATLHTPIHVRFMFENQTIYPQELLIQVESSPGFMFSGRNKHRLRVLPTSPQILHYTYISLNVGYNSLPRLRVHLMRLNAAGPPTADERHSVKMRLEENMLRSIPTHLFIVPPSKSDQLSSASDCAVDCPPRISNLNVRNPIENF